MGTLDIKSIAVTGFVLHAALGLALLLTYLTRKTYPGFRSWTVGWFCWVGASSAFFVRPVLGDAATILLANPLLFLFAIFLHNGMIRFHDLPGRPRRLAEDAALACAGLGLIAVNAVYFHNPSLRVCVNSVVTGVLLLRAGLEPLALPKARRNPSQLVISLCLAGMVAFLAVRAVAAIHDSTSPSMAVWGALIKPALILSLFAGALAVYEFISLTHTRLEEELLEAQAKLQELAHTDSLTGLLNRRGFAQRAEGDVKRARRYRHDLSLLIFDLDNFKAINDTHGHAIGDEVLALIGRACRKALREADTMARWGGEEFAVLMPETGLGEAMGTGERLRLLVRELRVGQGEDVRTTASFGVARLGEETFEELAARADEALYRAKREGRDRVCAAKTGPA